MNERTRRLLLMQGFCYRDVDTEPGICHLARWTPLSCAAFGTAGLVAGLMSFGTSSFPAIASLSALCAGSGWFFIVLGLLTLTGGLTRRSIYDRLYNATVKHIFRTSPVPRHGAPRRFGCAIGGVMYGASGIGFLSGNVWLAFIPAAFMVGFAAIAGLTQWCFASALYAGVFHRCR